MAKSCNKMNKSDMKPPAISDQALRQALNNPTLVKYAESLQRIPMAYKKLLKEQASG